MPRAPRLSLLAGLLALAPTALAQTAVPIGGAGAAGALTRRHQLSDLDWIVGQSGFGPVERDRSVGGPAAGDGGPLEVEGRRFRHGLGTAAPSLVRYDLQPSAQAFASWVGVDDEVGSAGSVVFRVFGDGVSLFDSGTMTGTDPALWTGWIDVTGVDVLELVVTDAGDGYANDHAVWGHASLIQSGGGPVVGDGAEQRWRYGQWEDPIAWPLMAIHASLLPSGEILSSASASANAPGDESPAGAHDATVADLADAATFTHTSVDHAGAEHFGAGVARGSDGRVLALGGFGGRNAGQPAIGTFDCTHFAGGATGWLPAPVMRQPRFGASGLALGNGDVLAIGGQNAAGNLDLPEVFDGRAWRILTGVDTTGMADGVDAALDDAFPFVHLASDGRVFWAGWGQQMGFLDTLGGGDWLTTQTRESRERLFGSSVSYDLDRVLVFGGADDAGGLQPGATSALTIDISGASAIVTPTAPTAFGRVDGNATILADGSVLATGGNLEHSESASPRALRVAERWEPSTGRWESLAEAPLDRGYRSTALLLPDGRVWTAGGPAAGGERPTAQLYSPPYLYLQSGGGALAARPVIQSAPSTVHYDEPFAVQMASSATIARVTLVRLGCATHGVNGEQRFLELAFTQAGTALDVDAPLNGNHAPPGDYMLFAIRPSGVPSVAAIVRLERPRPTSCELLASTDGSTPTARHEASMVEVGGQLYLMGGRGARPIERYDPVTGVWTNLGNPPLEMHHFQPVVVGDLVWVVSAFEGNYPNETNVPNVWTWDPRSNVWTMGAAIPGARNRGSAGTVAHAGKIYVVGGNTMGHNGGTVPWLDVYDPGTGTWTALADAPNGRDHFQAVVVGNKLVAAAGRETDLPVPFDKTVAAVDLYDFASGTWTTAPLDLPTERAGTMSVGCGRHVLVIGGESATQTQAHVEIEALNVPTGEWLSLPGLVQDRHSGGAGLHDGRVHIAVGSGQQGGSPELNTLEVLGVEGLLQGPDANLLANGAFDDGADGWNASGAFVLGGAAGIAAPAAELSAGELSQQVAATPSTAYALTALYRVAAGGGSIELRLEYLDGGGATLGVDSIALSPTSSLTSAAVGGTSPAGTAAVRVRVVATGSRVVTIDDLTLLEG